VTNICFIPTLYCHKERQLRFSEKSHHTTFNKTCHMCTSQTPNLLRTIFSRHFVVVTSSFEEALIPQWGSSYCFIEWWTGQQMAVRTTVNNYKHRFPATFWDYVREVQRTYTEYASYLEQMNEITAIVTDPIELASLRDRNPEYIFLLKCHYNVAVFRICMRILRRVISCYSSRTNVSLCPKLQPLRAVISHCYCITGTAPLHIGNLITQESNLFVQSREWTSWKQFRLLAGQVVDGDN